MRIVIDKGIHSMSHEIEVYDNLHEIKELISCHNDFHDGEVIGIDYNLKKRSARIFISYDDKNYWIDMENVFAFEISMDTKIIYLSEVVCEEIPGGVSVEFGECGLFIEAKNMCIRRLHK